MEEKKNHIAEWISVHKKAVLIIAACAAAVILIAVISVSLIQYESYETVSSYDHSRESNDSYIKFNGKIVQYGGDGITCLNADGSSAWSKSYEMEQPIICTTDHYLAAADQGGSEIYFFDSSGFLNSVETPYPVQQMALSDNGTAAVILEESDACRIVLYDTSGEVIVEGQAHLNDNGYPAAIALSQNGTTMAVSYLTVSSGELTSTITFYNFANTESGSASVSASDTYEGETIVRLAEIGGRFVAFGDTMIRVYGSGSSPSLRKEIELTDEIRSIAIGEDRFALVYDADEEEAAEYESSGSDSDTLDASGDAQTETVSENIYAIDIYGKNGSRMCHTLFDGDYQNLTFLENGSAVLLSAETCRIITGMGLVRFSADFGETICGVFSNKFSGYTFVFSDRIERVRLKMTD